MRPDALRARTGARSWSAASTTSTSTTSTSITNDLTSLSNALQSGNLTTAQSAFSTLMQDLGSSGILNNAQGSNVNTVV